MFLNNCLNKFQDDENILTTNKMKVIDQVFQDAIVEAAQAHNAYMIEKDKNDAIKAKQSLTVCYWISIWLTHCGKWFTMYFIYSRSHLNLCE